MTTTKERDQFIVNASKEGLDLATIHKLLRYATTLQRLAVAQCNGDWPYNGDRDRPLPRNEQTERWDKRYVECPRCQSSGVARSTMKKTREHRDEEWQDVPKGFKVQVCPDCRTQELVRACLAEPIHPSTCVLLPHSGDCSCDGPHEIKPIFQGDPRGAVLVLSTPNFPYTEDGRGRGLYVPPSRRF